MSQQTTSQPRELFGSRLGFILAAAGAAVGLGNIWGFPTQAASNGGGAFLLVYLVMILIVAFPMLVVEMAIGRHGQANPVDSMRALTNHPVGKKVGGLVGWIGLSVPSAVLAFYSIVGGWIICFMLGQSQTCSAWKRRRHGLKALALSVTCLVPWFSMY